MSSKELFRVNKNIAEWKVILKKEIISFFKRLSSYLLIISIIGGIIYSLMPTEHYTNENTIVIRGKCKSISFSDIGTGSKKIESVLFEFDNGRTYDIAPSHLQMTEQELLDTFVGKTLTLYVSSINSTRILAISDESCDYLTLDDTNSTNQYNISTVFCFFAFFFYFVFGSIASSIVSTQHYYPFASITKICK